MKSKRIASMILSGLMIVPSVMPVLASDEQTTNVYYNVDQTYTWSVHSDIDFGKDAGAGTTVESDSNVVRVTENVITEGSHLYISIKGSGTDRTFTISERNGTNLDYDVYNGTTKVATGENILNIEAGNNADSAELRFVLHTQDDTAEIAGDYSGTVTYTATIVADHTHNWVAQTEMVEHTICSVCETDLSSFTQSQINSHMKAEALAGKGSGYYSKATLDVVSYKCSTCGESISVEEYNNLPKES